jgi:hypothetical protein
MQELTTKNPNSKTLYCARGIAIETAFTNNTLPTAPTPIIYSTARARLVILNAWKSSLITRGHSKSGPCVIFFDQAAVGLNAKRIVRWEQSVTLREE